jgi:hypothetical protein
VLAASGPVVAPMEEVPRAADTFHVWILRACDAGIRRVSWAFPCAGTHAADRALHMVACYGKDDDGDVRVVVRHAVLHAALRGSVAEVLEG